jgi:hypothetical protein
MNQYPGANPYAAPQAPIGGGYAPGPYGAQGVSAYVEGKLLVAANGSTLPPMCLKCGQPPTFWRPQAYQYTPPWAFFVLGWIGLLIFSKRSSFQVPVCEEHRALWKKWNLIAGLSWIPGTLFFILGAMLMDSDGGVGAVLFLLGMAFFFVGLFTALIMRNQRIITVTRIDKVQTWLRGVHPNVLQAVAASQGATLPVAQRYGGGYPR